MSIGRSQSEGIKESRYCAKSVKNARIYKLDTATEMLFLERTSKYPNPISALATHLT